MPASSPSRRGRQSSSPDGHVHKTDSFQSASSGYPGGDEREVRADTVHLGSRGVVQLKDEFMCGTVRFLGTTSFHAGEWVGVELDECIGKNSGVVEGIKYFDCKPNAGVFVRRRNIRCFTMKHLVTCFHPLQSDVNFIYGQILKSWNETVGLAKLRLKALDELRRAIREHDVATAANLVRQREVYEFPTADCLLAQQLIEVYEEPTFGEECLSLVTNGSKLAGLHVLQARIKLACQRHALELEKLTSALAATSPVDAVNEEVASLKVALEAALSEREGHLKEIQELKAEVEMLRDEPIVKGLVSPAAEKTLPNGELVEPQAGHAYGKLLTVSRDVHRKVVKQPFADALSEPASDTPQDGNDSSTRGQDDVPKMNLATTHGPIVGEVTETSAVVWFRDEKPHKSGLRLTWWPVEPNAVNAGCVTVFCDPKADFTSKTLLTALKPGSLYRFKVGGRSGSFRTAGFRALSFVFGSCLGGQGYGRNAVDDPNGEGYPIFVAMKALEPNFFHFNGDCIYADDIIEAVSTQPLSKGRKNQVPSGVTLGKATTIEEFRAKYKYQLEDPTYADFLANTPVYNTWDDHEIIDDWGAQREQERGLGDLVDAGRRAFFEYWPLRGPPEEPHRIYRCVRQGPHMDLFILDCRSYRALHREVGEGKTPQMDFMLGKTQSTWLCDRLRESTATWKFIASSVPLSYPTGWPKPEETGYDGFADGNSNTITGAEAELLSIFECIRDAQITGVVVLAGDTHFPYVISYDPFDSGKPLAYEIGCSPLHALCLPVNDKPDMSLKPTHLYESGAFAGNFYNFGHVVIAEDGHLTLTVRDAKGESLYELRLPPPAP